DVILANILSLRSMGRRITSVDQVMTAATRGVPGAGGGGRGGPPNPQQQAIQNTTQQLTTLTTVNTTDVELTFFVKDPARTQPLRLVAILTRNGTRSTVSWQLW